MKKNLKLYVLAWFPIALIPMFNDFPLFGGVSILRSPSIFSYILFLPLILIWFFRTPAYRKSVSDVRGLIYIFWIFLFLVFLFKMLVLNFYNDRDELAFRFFMGAFITMTFLLIMSLTFQSLTKYSIKELFEHINSAVLFASWSLVIYGLIEFTAPYSGLSNTLLFFLEYIFHDRPIGDYYGNSIRSLAFEPSYLTLPIVFLLALNFINIHKKSNLLVVFFLFLIGILSGSRLLAVILMVTIFIYFALRRGIGMKTIIYSSLMIVPFGFILVETILSLFTIDANMVSNIQRYGTYVAGFYLILDYPIFGVGFGLGGGYLDNYYPDFFYGTYTSDIWIQGASFGGSFLSWPIRFVAEVGLFGTILAFSISFIIVRRLFKMRNKYSPNTVEKKSIDSILSLWFILPIASFGIDGYIFMGFWINLGLTLFLIQKDENLLFGYNND